MNCCRAPVNITYVPSFCLQANPADTILPAPPWSTAGSKSAREPPQTKHCKGLWSLKACGRCAPGSRATMCLLLPRQVKKQTLLYTQACKLVLTREKNLCTYRRLNIVSEFTRRHRCTDRPFHFQIFFPHSRKHLESSGLYLTPSTHQSPSETIFTVKPLAQLSRLSSLNPRRRQAL